MYGNCLLCALIEKIKHPQNKIYRIGPNRRFIRDCHYMWKNQQGEFHFTRIKGSDALCEYWFKGHVDELKPGTIKEFKGRRFL